MDSDNWMVTSSCKPSPDDCPLLEPPPQLSPFPIIHCCVRARVPGRAHLHPFAPAAHRVAEHEEEDERHGGRDGQRDQEVREVVSGLHGLGRRVVFPKLGQDAGAGFRAGDVHRDHFVDVNLKGRKNSLCGNGKTLFLFSTHHILFPLLRLSFFQADLERIVYLCPNWRSSC